MLFKFKSQAASDLIMLEADARSLLKIMLGDDPVKGIVQVQDLASAVAALTNAVLQDTLARQQRAYRRSASLLSAARAASLLASFLTLRSGIASR